MARTIRSPRTEVVELAAEDIVALWRCAEATAASNFTDDGPNGITLTQVSSPIVTDDVATGATGQGGRYFDGAADYAHVTDSAYIADLRAACSAWAWVEPDASGPHTILAYGYTGGGVNNVVLEVRITASTFLELFWQYGAASSVTVTTDIFVEDSGPQFIGVVRETDPDNSGKVRVRVYHFHSRTREWSTYLATNLVNNDTTTTARFTLAASSSLANFYTGAISDAGFAKVALHEWWFREQARHGRGACTYSQADLLDADVTSQAYKAIARVRVEDDARAWRDLSNLDPHDDDLIKTVRFKRRVEDGRSSAEVTVHRSRGKLNLALDDADSPWHANGVLLQGRRRARVEYALVPARSRPVEEWEWEGLLEGWIDDPRVTGEEVAFTILDHTTILADMEIIETAKYGTKAGTTVFDDTLQAIVDDNDPGTFGGAIDPTYLGGVTPTLYFPAATGLTHNDFASGGMTVLSKIDELVENQGFDCRVIYDDVRHEDRITVYEPDRSTASVQWTWDETDYFSIPSYSQTVSETVNACRVYYGPTASLDALGEPVRAYEEYVDTTSVGKYGFKYGEFSEGSGSLIDTSAEALDLATLTVYELSDPIGWFNVLRPFHPFVELGDRIRFSADGDPVRLFSAATDVAVIGIEHTFEQDGSAHSSFEMRGLRAASRGTRIFPRMTSRGAPQAPVKTLDTPTGLAWDAAVGGGVLRWDYPSGRWGRAADLHEIHLGASSGFTPDTSDPSTSLVGVVRGTTFPVFGYLAAESMPGYAKVFARDRFNNASAASSAVAITAFYTAQVPSFRASHTGNALGNNIGATPTKVTCDIEDFDAGSDYDNATNYRFTAPRDGLYFFDGQVALTTAAQQMRAFLYVDGSAEINGAWVDDLGVGFSQAPAARVSGNIYLTAGQYVELYAIVDTTRTVQADTYFSGHLVSEG